jgi:twitching motility protein PilI
MEAGKHLGKLREFSTQLAERIKAAPQRPTEPMRLAVRIASTHYLLDMPSAGEIVPAPDIAPVPWTQPWYRGLANVRGRLVGVVDLMQMAGRAPMPGDQSLQLLVLSDALKVNVALLITRAFGLRNVKDLESLGTAASDVQPWEAERYRDLDGTVMTELKLGRLVASETFAAIGV